MRNPCLLLAALTLTTPAIANAKADTPKPIETLARTAKWNMHYTDDTCSIWGEFGEGKAKITLSLTRYEPGSMTEIALYGDRFAKLSPYSKVTIDFNSDGTRTEALGINGKAGKLPTVMVGKRDLADRQSTNPEIPLPLLTPAQEDAVESLTVRIGRESPFRLPISPAQGVWGALRTCTSSLMQRWGFDPEQQASLKQRATPLTSPAQWLLPADFPASALQEGQIGLVVFRLDIAATGAVDACHVQMETKPANFAAITCAALQKRARLSPALDRDGKPIRSFYVNSVRWLQNAP